MHATRTFSAWLVPLVLALNGARTLGDSPPLIETVLEVSLRADVEGDTMVVLRGPDGSLYLDEQEFTALRLRVPDTPAHPYEGRKYFAPADLKGCSVAIDEARQRAVISAPASAFDTNHLSAAERQHPSITRASPGAFLNYQLSAQQIAGQTTGGAFGELGVFAGAGVLTTTAIGRDAGGYSGEGEQLVRLDTTFTRDFPDRLETLNVGDAISDGGSWGNALRYAGIRWSRNFALRPDLLTTPLLSTAGTAVVPSTVDVFVNNQLVTSNQVPAGPFVIDRLPTVSGSGDVNVVVRDAFGREQVVTQSFYSSVSLLARDLTQYSFNVGSVREDYGLASDRYGATLAEANYRRGVTDDLTLEGHGEYLAGDAHAAGLNAAWGVGHFGIVNVTVAEGGESGSRGSGSGWLTGMGFEHRGAGGSFVINSLWASSEFGQVGEPLDSTLRMRQRTLAQGSLGLGRFGSVSLAYVRETYRSSAQQTVGLTHSVSLGRAGTLNLSVSRTHTAEQLTGPAQDSTSAYLIYVFTLDGRHTASATAVGGRGSGAPQSEVIAGFAESPPVGPGSGYRLSASSAGNYDADWRQQFSGAAVEVEAARNQGIDGRSAIATGAMTFLDGAVNTTRSVNGSFAMVDVAGLPDVPVYVENQLTTHTDSAGRALLYNLRPYEANRISIAPEDLPLDTAIASSSTVMAPPYRSGVIARFPVERIKSATFRLVTDDGTAVPVGANVTLLGAIFPVVRDGLVYVTGYDHGMAAEAVWPTGRCEFRLQPPPGEDPLPDLGTIRCHSADAGAIR